MASKNPNPSTSSVPRIRNVKDATQAITEAFGSDRKESLRIYHAVQQGLTAVIKQIAQYPDDPDRGVLAIDGFGTFVARIRKSRHHRNIICGQDPTKRLGPANAVFNPEYLHTSPARVYVTFIPSGTLMTLLNMSNDNLTALETRYMSRWNDSLPSDFITQKEP